MVSKYEPPSPKIKNLGLNADHRGMVKFKDASDILYEDVRSNMKKLVNEVGETTKE